MSTKIQILLIFFMIMALTAPRPADCSSSYHLNGIGLIMTTQNADAYARGGTEIGILNRTTINTANPANLIIIDISRFSATYISEQVQAKTNTMSGRYNYYNIHNVRLAVPIITNRLVVTLGVQPFSRNDFKSVSDKLLSTGGVYTREILKKGGISQFQFGFATSLKKRFALGLIMNYNFGRIEENWQVKFVSDIYRDTSDRLITQVNGLNLRAGFLAMLFPGFSFGATYSMPMDLTAKQKIQYSFSDVQTLLAGRVKLPQELGLGASWLNKHNVRISADFKYTPWKQARYLSKKFPNVTDAISIHAGVEKLGTKKMSKSIFPKIALRAGFYYASLGMKTEQNKSVSEMMGTAGFSVPYYNGWGSIDIGLGWGKRGHLPDFPVEESVMKFMITISGGEKWFVRPKK